MNGRKEKGWWMVDIGNAYPGACLVAVGERSGVERDTGSSSFGGRRIFEYCSIETIFDIVNVAKGSARNDRRGCRMPG
jgi:hypothetical protein